MVITIAFRDRPDEVLYSFSEVGDSVCIGRDKRKCKIALGVNAQGVSRIHLKLELLRNGRLLLRDTSTYGTGYDGGPLEVVREKELKPFMVLQVGTFFFIIEEKDVKRKCIEETIACTSLGIAETNSQKRSASNKTTILVEEECIVKKSKVLDTAVKKLTPEMCDSERKVTSAKVGATVLSSRLCGNSATKRSIQFGNLNNVDESLVVSKRIKVVENEDKNKLQELEENISSVETRMLREMNTGENDQMFGGDIEILRMKLRKAVQYENLERLALPKAKSQSQLSGHFQETNYKRFTKAAQGSHFVSGLLQSVTTRITSVADLINFREIA